MRYVTIKFYPGFDQTVKPLAEAVVPEAILLSVVQSLTEAMADLQGPSMVVSAKADCGYGQVAHAYGRETKGN